MAVHNNANPEPTVVGVRRVSDTDYLAIRVAAEGHCSHRVCRDSEYGWSICRQGPNKRYCTFVQGCFSDVPITHSEQLMLTVRDDGIGMTRSSGWPS